MPKSRRVSAALFFAKNLTFSVKLIFGIYKQILMCYNVKALTLKVDSGGN
jgi:hypothetical protein